MQVGMNYAYFPTDKIYMNAGFSVQHLNSARESFFTTDPAGFDARIPKRYIGFLNGSFKTSELVIVNPMAYYTNQAGASEAVIGLNAQYNLSTDGDQQVIGGMYYRVGDAVIPMIGFVYKNIRLMFTYDVTVSSLSKYMATGAPGNLHSSITARILNIMATGVNRFVPPSNNNYKSHAKYQLSYFVALLSKSAYGEIRSVFAMAI